jgi:homopolymeric O-antigen transport system permease protein
VQADITSAEGASGQPAKSRAPRVIEANDGNHWPDRAELWRFRHLLYTLVERNVKVRYKNTGLGLFWMVLQPGLQVLIYTLIFGVFARLPTGGVPYAVFVLSGLFQIFFINTVISGSAGSVRANQGVSKKIYFPKLILPAVVIASALVDYGLHLLLLLAVMALNSFLPPLQILLLPLILLSLCVMLLGLSFWFTALGVRYRDVTLLMPSISMLIMYLSPVVYPITLVPVSYQPLYAMLNPFVGFITALKWCLVGAQPFHPWMLFYSIGASVVILIGGFFFFIRTERSFNDYL